MITTREINVNLTRGKLKLRQSTTKNVDASSRVEPPKGKIKPRGISTTTQADVADIAEKKRRDDIAKEKKIAMRDAKKIVIAKKVKKEKELKQKEKEKERLDMVAKEKAKTKLVEPSRELMVELTKKPWNKMNAKERKEYQVEKAKKKEGLK